MNVLVDTSVWSLALRRPAHRLNAAEKVIVTELSELIKEGRTRIIGLIRQELLSGIKEANQFDKLRTVLRAFPDEPLDTNDHEAAALAGNKCRSKGISVQVVDALICAVAESRGWSIFSTDPDFNRQALVLSIRLHKAREK